MSLSTSRTTIFSLGTPATMLVVRWNLKYYVRTKRLTQRSLSNFQNIRNTWRHAISPGFALNFAWLSAQTQIETLRRQIGQYKKTSIAMWRPPGEILVVDTSNEDMRGIGWCFSLADWIINMVKWEGGDVNVGARWSLDGWRPEYFKVWALPIDRCGLWVTVSAAGQEFSAFSEFKLNN